MIAFAALWPFLSVQCAIVSATKGNKIPSQRGAARVAPVRRKFPNPEPILQTQSSSAISLYAEAGYAIDLDQIRGAPPVRGAVIFSALSVATPGMTAEGENRSAA